MCWSIILSIAERVVKEDHIVGPIRLRQADFRIRPVDSESGRTEIGPEPKLRCSHQFIERR